MMVALSSGGQFVVNVIIFLFEIDEHVSLVLTCFCRKTTKRIEHDDSIDRTFYMR